jgi:hypothetical protein
VEGRREKKFQEKWELPHKPLVAGLPPAAGRHLRLWDSSNFFEIFLFKKKEFLEVWVMGQGF